MTFQFQTLSEQMSLLNIDLPIMMSTAPTSFQLTLSRSPSCSHHSKAFDSHDSGDNVQHAEIPHSSISIEMDTPSPESKAPSKSGRTLRRRSSENDYFMHRTNRRTIKKPKKLPKKQSTLHIASRDIKKLYLNQTLKGFRPRNLETIFEEPAEESSVMSVRKYNRNQSLSDGLNATKKTLKRRRDRIKKKFGKKYALKKISLELFHKKLNMSPEHHNASDSDIQYLNRGDN